MKTTDTASGSAEKKAAKGTFDARVLIQAGALAWLVIAVVLFMQVSRAGHVQSFDWPGLPAFAAHLGRIDPGQYVLDLVRAVAGAVAFSAACLSVGLRVLMVLRIPQRSALAYGTTAFVIGEILFALLFLSVISTYRLPPAIPAVALALGLLAGLGPLRAFLRDLPRPRLPSDFGREDKLRLWLAVLILGSALLLSSARLGYDAVTQYFSNAKIIAVSQAPDYFLQEPFLVSSLHPVMLFSALIQLFGDQAARLLPWLNGLAIVLMGLAIGDQLGLSRRERLWFLVLMVSTTAFVDLLGDGKVELITTAPILAGIYWMLASLDEPSGKLFALIGFLVGFAMIARLYSVPLVGLFMTLLYAGHLLVRARLGRTEVRRFIRAGVWLLPPLAFLGLFHLIQLGLWLGGPATPAAAAASAVPTVEAEDWQWTIDPANLGWYRLFYPLTITFLSTPQGLGNISALFVGLLLLPAVTGLRRNFRLDSRLALVGLCALATLLAWVTAIFAIFEIRYVLFLWILLYMVAAKVFERAIENSRQPIRVLASTVVLALLAYMALRTPVIALDTYSPVSLDGQAHCYDSPLCTFLEPLNQSAGPGERVLALNAYRYYLRPDLFACSSRAEEYPPLQPLAHGGSAEFWAEAYRQGFAFVAYEAHFAQRHSRFGKLPDPQRAPDWLRVSVISRDPFGQFVYRIQPLDPPFQPEKTCVQTPGGSWLVQNSR